MSISQCPAIVQKSHTNRKDQWNVNEVKHRFLLNEISFFQKKNQY